MATEHSSCSTVLLRFKCSLDRCLRVRDAHPTTQTDVRERLAGQGLFVKTGTPAELTALMQSEIAKWAKVIKAAGIKIE